MKWFVSLVSMLSLALVIYHFAGNTNSSRSDRESCDQTAAELATVLLNPTQYDKEIRDLITVYLATVDYLEELYKTDMFWFGSNWSDLVLENNISEINAVVNQIDSMKNDELLYLDILKLFAGEYSPSSSLYAKNMSSDQQDALDKIYESNKSFFLNLRQDESSEKRKIAAGLLKYYKQSNISLTDYFVSSSRDDYKSWTFRELHSGVEFLFELNDCDTDYPTWGCSPIQQSYSKYIENRFKALH